MKRREEDVLIRTWGEQEERTKGGKHKVNERRKEARKTG